MAGPLHRRRVIRLMAAMVATAVVVPVTMAAKKRTEKRGVKRAELYSWHGFALGAEVSLQLYHHDAAMARRIIKKSVNIIENMADLFSLYQKNSRLSILNRDRVLYHPPAEFTDLLRQADRVSRLTSGAFDITVQPLWKFYQSFFSQQHNHGPSRDELAAVDRFVDYKKLIVSADKIAFERPGMAATLNGIAQGYATDRVSDYLKSEGLTAVLVDIGEYRALGPQADRSPWRIALADPENPGEFAQIIDLTHGAVATSSPLGDVFDVSGVYNHLFDPHSGLSANRYSSVTVTAPTATLADALSTAFCVMAEKDIVQCLKKTPAVTARLTYAGARGLGVVTL